MLAMAARGAVGVAALLVATPASMAVAAGPPVIERVHVEAAQFVEAGLSEECGFDVQGSFSLNLTIRSFSDGSRLIGTSGVQNRLTFTAHGHTVKFVETVHEVGRIAPDGTLTYSQSGRSWLEGLIGHWVIDPDADDFISVAGRSIDRQEVCRRLAA